MWKKPGLLKGGYTQDKPVCQGRCASAYILTRSPSFRVTSGSLFKGEKWQTQLFTDTQVGKAIPVEGKSSQVESSEALTRTAENTTD